MPTALGDLTVIDVTVARAGPTCARQFADWGATVIRIEPPDSPDSVESAVGNRDGSDFQNMHRNKRSLSLNLKDPRGRELFYELAARADVIIENMRPGVKHRLGIDYETIHKVNPRLVYGSISGFGQDGPYAELASMDQVAQGMGGLMSVTGLPGQGPVRAGVAISDLAAGMYLSIGILAALHEREHSGQGQWVRTSLLEAMIAMLDFQAVRWTIDGVVPEQEGNSHPTGTPVGCFETADGHINVAAPHNRIFGRLCRAIGLEELIEDPRFDTLDARALHRPLLMGIVADRLRTRTSAEWMELLNTAGVPAGPVNRIDEVFSDVQVRHLDMIAEVQHPELGTLPLIRNAVSMSRTPSTICDASPGLGEHSAEILAGLGHSSDEVSELRRSGVI